MLAGGKLGAGQMVGLDGSADADALGVVFGSCFCAHHSAVGVNVNVRAASDCARQGQPEVEFRAGGKLLVGDEVDAAAGDSRELCRGEA